jgi:hypothetical protein
MAGYSTTPLPKKLGIKEQSRVLLVQAPPGFVPALGTLAAGVSIADRGAGPFDLILLFVTRESDLRRSFPRLATRLVPAGMLWVAWPKKASGVETDLSFDRVQKTGLGCGLVDTKICAVDDVWSGLRFVIRLEDRPRRPGSKGNAR